MPSEPALQNPCDRFVRLVLLLTLAGQLTACRKLAVQDLIGKWRVDYGNSKLTLKLNPDSTFEQVFEKQGETNIIRRGTWELTEFEGPSVLLRGALFVHDDTGAIDSKLSANSNGGWVLHVNKTFGHLSLTVNEDLGLYFEKSHE